MSKKGSLILYGVLLLGLLVLFIYFGIKSLPLNIINQDSRLDDKFSLIDCGNDDICGSPDDVNVDDTLIFENNHKIDVVLELNPENACGNNFIVCKSGFVNPRKIFNRTLKIDGRQFNLNSDRLTNEMSVSRDVKAEIFYTWGIQDSQKRYVFDPRVTQQDCSVLLSCLTDCKSMGLCYNEYGSLIFRIEPTGQGATTTIPITTTVSLAGSTSSIQTDSTTGIHQQNKARLSFFARIWLYLKNLYSKII